jgi:hypothetical protein
MVSTIDPNIVKSRKYNYQIYCEHREAFTDRVKKLYQQNTDTKQHHWIVDPAIPLY